MKKKRTIPDKTGKRSNTIHSDSHDASNSIMPNEHNSHNLSHSRDGIQTNGLNGINGKNGLNGYNGIHQNGNGVNEQVAIIPEVEGEHEHEDEQRENEVQKFLKEAKLDLQRKGQNTQDLNLPRNINGNGIKNPLMRNPNPIKSSGGPTMLANIGPTKKNLYVDDENMDTN